MSNPSVVTLQLPASVSNGIALSQTLAAAGKLTLNGSLATAGVASLVTAQRVGIASTSNQGATAFTVTGTDRNGNVASETLTGVNNNTIQSQRDYLTVTSITLSAAAVGSILAGTVGVGSTEWVHDDFYARFWALSVNVRIISGAVTFTVEHTYDDPNTIATNMPQQWSTEAASTVPAFPWPNALLNGRTANGEAQYPDQPIMAHRLTITAGTGLAQMQTIQAGAPGPS